MAAQTRAAHSPARDYCSVLLVTEARPKGQAGCRKKYGSNALIGVMLSTVSLLRSAPAGWHRLRAVVDAVRLPAVGRDV